MIYFCCISVQLSPCPLCHSQIRLPISPNLVEKNYQTKTSSGESTQRHWAQSSPRIEGIPHGLLPSPQLLTAPLFTAIPGVPSGPPSSCPNGSTTPWHSYPNGETNMDARLPTQLRTCFRFPGRCPLSVVESRPGHRVGLTCRVAIVSPICASLSGLPSFLTLPL